MTRIDQIGTTRGEGSSTLDVLKDGRWFLILTVERNTKGQMAELVLERIGVGVLWRHDLAADGYGNVFAARMRRSSYSGTLKIVCLTYGRGVIGGADRAKVIVDTEVPIEPEAD